jgi:hypothetical protein
MAITDFEESTFKCLKKENGLLLSEAIVSYMTDLSISWLWTVTLYFWTYPNCLIGRARVQIGRVMIIDNDGCPSLLPSNAAVNEMSVPPPRSGVDANSTPHLRRILRYQNIFHRRIPGE